MSICGRLLARSGMVGGVRVVLGRRHNKREFVGPRKYPGWFKHIRVNISPAPKLTFHMPATKYLILRVGHGGQSSTRAHGPMDTAGGAFSVENSRLAGPRKGKK